MESDPGRYGQPAVGKHPTGMQSCFATGLFTLSISYAASVSDAKIFNGNQCHFLHRYC